MRLNGFVDAHGAYDSNTYKALYRLAPELNSSRVG